MPDPSRTGERLYRGIPVSGGVCRGKIRIVGGSEIVIPRYEVEDSAREMKRFEEALVKTRHEILNVQRQVKEGIGAQDASIFDAHLLVLEDPTLIGEVTNRVTHQKMNVEAAFHDFSEHYAETLSKINDDFLRERVADVRDVSVRVLNNLLGRQDQLDLSDWSEPCILVCHDLAPSITASLDRNKVIGFATDVGSKTSHTAIMARSLGIPAVVGLKDVSRLVAGGEAALLDGFNGVLIINPSDQSLFEYGELIRKKSSLDGRLLEIHDEKAVTADGVAITLSANIEQAEDGDQVKNYGAEGVGLFRTEYLFLHRNSLPTEEEQYEAYRKVAGALKPAPVVIRTLDLGGDKFLAHLKVPSEMNPFLGWRAIRFCLQEKDIFRAQLRAILRASVEKNVKMMYPMISCLDELHQANALVEEYKDELRRESIPFDENMEIGAMVEIPAAALAADSLARHVDFFSIGTNDLIQYTLAVDRLNEKIAHLYEPTHPAMVRLIKMTVEAARKNNIWCGVCGEMAGDPALTPLLLGLGVDELSAAPPVVPQIKYLIRNLKISDAKDLAEFALSCDSGVEILEKSEALARKVAPSLFENKVDA